MRKKSDATATACDVYTRIHFSVFLALSSSRSQRGVVLHPRLERNDALRGDVFAKVVKFRNSRFYYNRSCFLPLAREREKERKGLKKETTAIERFNRPDIGLDPHRSGLDVFRIEWRALGSVVDRIEFQGGRFAPPAESGQSGRNLFHGRGR